MLPPGGWRGFASISSSVFGSYVYVRVCTCSFWPIWLGGMPSEAKGAALRKKSFLRGLSQLHRCPWVGRWWLSIPAALERLLVPTKGWFTSSTFNYIAKQLIAALIYAPDQRMARPCAPPPPQPIFFALARERRRLPIRSDLLATSSAATTFPDSRPHTDSSSSQSLTTCNVGAKSESRRF